MSKNRFDIQNNHSCDYGVFSREILIPTDSNSPPARFFMGAEVSFYPANCGLAILHNWQAGIPFNQLRNDSFSLSKEEYEWIQKQYYKEFFDYILKVLVQKPYFEATAIRHEHRGIIDRVLGIKYPTFDRVLKQCPYADMKYTFENPNSGNEIGVWLIENPHYSIEDESDDLDEQLHL